MPLYILTTQGDSRATSRHLPHSRVAIGSHASSYGPSQLNGNEWYQMVLDVTFMCAQG